MSGDPRQDYFADGVVDEIITTLSHFRQLFVIARNSSFTYKGRTVDARRLARAWRASAGNVAFGSILLKNSLSHSGAQH